MCSDIERADPARQYGKWGRMEIVGQGFLARNLRPIASAHSGVVVAAAGVSAAGGTSEEAFAREAGLLYELIHRCKEKGHRLVFFSTASTGMYSTPGEPGREDGPVFPATPYGRHKLALEAVLAASAVDYLILRLGHVVGAAQPPHQLLPAMVRQVMSGRVRLFRGARRDLIDIDDVVTIVDRLLATGVNRTVVNVLSGAAPQIDEIIDDIEAILGRSTQRTYTATGGNQQVSTVRLRRLVGDVAGMGFDKDYYRRVLAKYVPSYATPRSLTRGEPEAAACDRQ
ncbi:NAD-dependent epimerase/dehydratase family protein [Streptomyces inhibens]|uniref:NAD-dependent epimerase/dehydratase family protein n=1 Tax=Streptomyces inhibens TaxID=2293571 RepID=UPI001EE71EA5|nr:NAD-dependent epimerase/dehydratase family protein [Streptomyces inhibens]UKY51778.1 NAD-dependent epimerase/dehydratase family protein [Streptomyces inhibens]